MIFLDHVPEHGEHGEGEERRNHLPRIERHFFSSHHLDQRIKMMREREREKLKSPMDLRDLSESDPIHYKEEKRTVGDSSDRGRKRRRLLRLELSKCRHLEKTIGDLQLILSLVSPFLFKVLCFVQGLRDFLFFNFFSLVFFLTNLADRNDMSLRRNGPPIVSKPGPLIFGFGSLKKIGSGPSGKARSYPFYFVKFE